MEKFISGYSKVIHPCTLLLAILLFAGCTEHKKTVPFDFPDYTPRLIVLSSVGTISGAEASLSWSKPLNGQSGTVPLLPDLSVFLLENGMRMKKFTSVKDSAGYFIIPPDELELKESVPYAIEIFMEDKGESIFSESCRLPEKPILENVKVYVDENTPFWFDLTWSQAEAGEGIGAISLYPFLLDSENRLVDTPRLGYYYLSSEFRYIDERPVPPRNGKKRFERLINVENSELAAGAEIRLAYLSPELARFKKEMDELGYLGESIYQTVRPLYSNIIGAEGIFGLYNESFELIRFD